MKPWKTLTIDSGSADSRMLQWGHGDEAVEDSDEPEEGSRYGRFNGATAMKPWKTGTPPTFSSTIGAASMGPRR